jgi:hypothetical protein
VYSDGQNKSQVTAGTYVYERRICQNNVCPIDTSKGETQSAPCGQANGSLTRAASVFEAVNNASKDMICSTD